MPAQYHKQLFLSAVSDEFKSYRDLLASDLNRPELSVKVQEDFVVSGGMTLEKLEQMLSRQMSEADKRARADFVVDTGGTFDDTHAQVDIVIESLKGQQGTAFAKFWA